DTGAPAATQPPDSGWREWLAQLDEPAALLRPAPWCFGANAALEALLGEAPRDAAALGAAFGEGDGELATAFARGQAFSGRLRWESAADSGAVPVLLHADFAPLESSEGLWLCTCVDLTALQRNASRRATTLQHLQHTLNQVHDLISLLDSTET